MVVVVDILVAVISGELMAGSELDDGFKRGERKSFLVSTLDVPRYVEGILE
jgi:hypothetical protein